MASRGCSTVGNGMLPVMMTVGKSYAGSGLAGSARSAACAWHSAMAAAANKVNFMVVPGIIVITAQYRAASVQEPGKNSRRAGN